MEQVDETMRELDEQAGPGNMTQEEAAEFYEEVAAHCRDMAQAIRDDLRVAQGDED